MSEAIDQYRLALRDRRTGIMSELDGENTFLEVKPDFYADSRVLSEDALQVFEAMKQTNPPYGLVDGRGNSFVPDADRSPWMGLTVALRATGHAVFETAEPRLAECPYHEVLARKLGGTALTLQPYDNNERGLDTLRNVVTPGAELNAPLFVSLLRRLPEIQRLHGSQSDPEGFARRSVGLLREPLNHPQQWAAGFVYSLGAINELLRPTFLNDELALRYTKVEQRAGGADRLAWAMPTEEFTLRQEVRVVNRVTGSERAVASDSNSILYPRGTRLADIAVDEPIIGCPGDQLPQPCGAAPLTPLSVKICGNALPAVTVRLRLLRGA